MGLFRRTVPSGAHSERAASGPEQPVTLALQAGSAPYYPWVDVLRGLSWILVVIAHSGVPGAGYAGRVGVGIFFAISGWLITGIILRQKDHGLSFFTTFYTRRCLRILPLYALLAGGVIFLSYFFGHWKTSLAPWPQCQNDLAEHTLWPYAATFAVEYWRAPAGGLFIGHCWSLGVEERCYVFLPLLLALCPAGRRMRSGIVLLLAAAFTFTVFRYGPDMPHFPVDGETVSLFLMPFPMLFGITLAVLCARRRPVIPAVVALPGCALCLYAYLRYAQLTEPTRGPIYCAFSLVPGLLAAAIVALAAFCDSEPTDIVSRLLRQLGKISYGAYLFHVPFAFLGVKVGRLTGNPWDGPVLAVALTIPVAYFTHRWIEQPILDARRAVERRAGLRYLCTALQVLPILVGLILLCPPHAQRMLLRGVGTAIGLICCCRLAVFLGTSLRRRMPPAPGPKVATGRSDEPQDEAGEDTGLAPAA